MPIPNDDEATQAQIAGVIAMNEKRTPAQEQELKEYLSGSKAHWKDGDIEAAATFVSAEKDCYIRLVYHKVWDDISPASVLRSTTLLGPLPDSTAKVIAEILHSKRTLPKDRVDTYMLASDRGGEEAYLRVYLPQLCRAIGEWNRKGDDATTMPNSQTFIAYAERWVRPRVEPIGRASDEAVAIEALRSIAQAALEYVGEHH